MPAGTQAPRELDTFEVRQIAVASAADPRSVRKVLDGRPIRSSVRQRVRRAIRDLERRGTLASSEGEPR